MDMDEDLKSLCSESLFGLDKAEEELLELERGQTVDLEILNSIFRVVHSIKGAAGFFSLNQVIDVAHAAESVLDKMRSGQLEPDALIYDKLLRSIDILRRLFLNLNLDLSEEIAPLVERLEQSLSPMSQEKEKRNSLVQIFYNNKESEFIFQGEHSRFSHTLEDLELSLDEDSAGEWFFILQCPLDITTELIEDLEGIAHIIHQDFQEASALISFCSVIELDIISAFPAFEGQSLWGFNLNDKTTWPKNEKKKLAKEKDKLIVKKETSKEDENPSEQDKFIRVNVKLLDQLMSLSGELVLARNELLHHNAQEDVADEIIQASMSVSTVTSNLQECIMKTRMQSIKVVTSKFHRIVRDLSSKLGKKVELHIDGDEVELDKTIVEKLGDPLTHIIRNSLDHGLEDPEERLAVGKEELGKISIAASYAGDKVLLKITDDGRGLNADFISQRALEKGIISEDDLAKMNEKEIFRLLFAPGFSTVAEVTDISGRGVGMDVVISTFIQLSGTVDINSTFGHGTEICIYLPLTMAIMPLLLIESNDKHFALPQKNVKHILRYKSAISKEGTRISDTGNALILYHAEEIMPLINLSSIMNNTLVHALPNDDQQLAIIQHGQMQFGLILDKVTDIIEGVTKPLGKNMQGSKIYSGATILGNGNVTPILDCNGIAEICKINNITREQAKPKKLGEIANEMIELLLFKSGPNENLAIPLEQVKRTLRIKASELEQTAARLSIIYEDKPIPIIRLDEAAPVSKLDIDAHQNYQIIIFEIDGHKAGLICQQINEIKKLKTEFSANDYRFIGISGATTHKNHPLLLVNLYELAFELLPHWRNSQIPSFKNSEKKILVVDDSIFFKNVMVDCLKQAGLIVKGVNNGQEAIDELTKNTYDAVILDVEMPVMTGLEMLRTIDKKILPPTIMVTASENPKFHDEALKAGAVNFCTKLDSAHILKACQDILAVEFSK